MGIPNYVSVNVWLLFLFVSTLAITTFLFLFSTLFLSLQLLHFGYASSVCIKFFPPFPQKIQIILLSFDIWWTSGVFSCKNQLQYSNIAVTFLFVIIPIFGKNRPAKIFNTRQQNVSIYFVRRGSKSTNKNWNKQTLFQDNLIIWQLVSYKWVSYIKKVCNAGKNKIKGPTQPFLDLRTRYPLS